jgi:hypothetical protein
MSPSATRKLAIGSLCISIAAGVLVLFWLAEILTERGYAVDNSIGYSTPLDTSLLVVGLALIFIPVISAIVISVRKSARERRAVGVKR